MFDEFGDVLEVEHSPAGLFHHDTRYLSRLHLHARGPSPADAVLDGADRQPDARRRPHQPGHVRRRRAGARQGHVPRLARQVPVAGELPRAVHGDELRRARASPAPRARVRRRLRRPVRDPRPPAHAARRGARRGARPAEVAFVYDSVDGLPRATRICFSLPPVTPDRDARRVRARARRARAPRARRHGALRAGHAGARAALLHRPAPGAARTHAASARRAAEHRIVEQPCSTACCRAPPPTSRC